MLRHHEELVGDAPLDTESESSLPLPEDVAGFRVEGVLGRGGMGVVCRARTADGRPVALKVLRPGLLTPTLLARFGREAETLARLRHPGIARLLDAGLAESPAGLQPYLAMELVEGASLREWASTPRSLAERVELLAKVCDVLEYAHGAGVVHRDLKPENVLVRPDGTPCVLDFGVARLTESDYRATTLITSTGVLVGTLRYMSPEQADGRPDAATARSDVYSLGVLAHELVSGRLPYAVPQDSIHRAIVAVMTALPEPLGPALGRDGERLDRVLSRALAKSPEDRYASAAELAADLRRVAAGRLPVAPAPRRGPRVPALVPLVLLAIAAAFAAGQWLGGVPWFREGAPVLGGRGRAIERATALLDSAAARVHAPGLAERAAVEAAAECDSARALLGRVGPDVAVRQLRGIAWALSMDAHWRLAEAQLEPGEYEACIAAGEQAERAAADAPGSAVLPAGTGALLSHLAAARYRQPRAVMALAASRLGLFSEPLAQQRRALEWNERALRQLDSLPSGTGDAEDPDPVLRELARRTLLAERGVMMAREALAADSVPLARAAVRALTEWETPPGGRDPDPRAGVRWSLRSGYAWYVLARLAGEVAALDSAESRFQKSLELARTHHVTVYVLESRALLADVHRLRARLAPGREAARRELQAALALIDAPAPGPAPALSVRYRALSGLRRAQVLLDLAGLEGSRALAEEGLAALAPADSEFGATTHPVTRSDLELEQARGDGLLWVLSGDRFLREAAVRHVEAAGACVDAAHDVGRARRVAAALAALGSPARRAPGLDAPVPSALARR